MYAPLKNKPTKKIKEKTKGTSIEEGIPEVPQLCHFQVSDFLESSSPKNELTHIKTCDLANAVDELDLEVDEDGTEEKESFVPLETKVENENVENSPICFGNEDIAENVDIAEVSTHQLVEKSYKTENQIVESKRCTGDNTENIAKDHNVRKNVGSYSIVSSDYNDLAISVKTLLEEINEPSAPRAIGGVSNINPYEKNMQVLSEDRITNLEKPIDISKYSFTIKLETCLSPYSDERLAEFYFNRQLYESKSYINEFINQEINNESKGTNKLYKLLVKYMQSKNSLKSNEVKIQNLKERSKICVSTMWTVQDNVNIKEEDKCTDGNIVTFVKQYTKAQFNTNVFQEFTSLLQQIKQIIYENYVMDSFTCSILRLKIEYYLQCLLTSCPEFTNLEEESPAALSSTLLNSHFQQCLSDLKIAIGVLFIFQRKQSLDIDSTFQMETRQWLSDLVSVFLRVGSWKDHIFLLHHILRCPGGFGDWATRFVQLPSKISSNPFNSLELNHMMTVMSILLSPIEQRENFIKKWNSELASDVNPWTVIDSDGEIEDDDQQTCPLKENDLVSLLNQIPFTDLFKALLQCDGRNIASGFVTSDYLLRLFSFFTDFIKILLSGLTQYSTQRYRQFTKRLGRLIYHIVQYATDVLIIFKAQNVCNSEMLRIQIEYDNFFLRSTKFIFSAKKHGTWQFLATIPYHTASSNAILKLYGILQLNDSQEDVLKVNFSTFEEKFLKIPEEEQFYLLTTFANIALARDVTELQFIKNVVLQLFYIGFLSAATMDHCYKNVKSLLCSICSTYPFLMSEILFIQKNMFLSNPNQEQRLSVYLWMKLPVDVWQPDKKDLETLSLWLLEPIESVQNESARIILQSLNYGIVQGELFIPLESHRAIALMLLKSHVKYVSDNEVGVIKNVSNLVCSQSAEHVINDWTWNTLLKLRLHLLDQSEAEICKCLYSLSDYLSSIPDVESFTELHHLVFKKHPVAIFIALMTTTLGHSVPIIFDKGFELVEVLLNLGKYEAGVACLEFMTLLFLDCNDSLYKCEKFICILSSLIAADNSYVQFAKNLISNNFPGPVLKLVESMLQNQLNCCRSLNFNKFKNIIQLWLLSLTRIPLWTQEPGILYLVDRLLLNSFFDNVSSKVTTTILEDLLDSNSPASETKSSFSSLVSWVNSKYNPPSLLLKGFNGDVPWYSYRIIQMEFEIYEKKNSIWIELLKELYLTSDKKANVDNSLKKVCNSLRVPVRPSSVLTIYKWCYQILETELSHPLIPLLWQRFFSLYFYRIPGLVDRGSVGMKFFDGIVNQNLFKRIQQRLLETCNHFKTNQEQTEEDIQHDYFSRCLGLFQTYSLWLDDLRLHEPSLNIHTLPIQYNPELLGLLIHGSETPWIEYVEYQNIEKSFRNIGLAWFKLKNRVGNEKMDRVLRRKREKSPTDNILERLNSYEVPLPPPSVNLKKYGFPRVNLDTLINSDKMTLFLKPFLKELLEYIKQYTVGVNEIVALGCDLGELLPRLYLTSDTQEILKKHCDGINKHEYGKTIRYGCSGPAVVKLTYEESKINEQAKQHFEHCDRAFDENIKKALSSLPGELITSAVMIDVAIEELKQEYDLATNRGNGGMLLNNLKGTGVHLFYEFVKTLCESIFHTPPIERVFEDYIDVLGKTFIEGNAEENDRLLHLILKDDMFGEKICKYFTPNASSTYDFIENYSKALEYTTEKRFIILLKFDIFRWLTENRPKFSDRSRMISAVGRGLKSVSKLPEEKNSLKLLNQHLETLLMYDFPEHYGEILNLLIEGSENQLISRSCWFMFINSLTCERIAVGERPSNQNIFEPGQPVKKLKYYFSKFARDQNLISFEIIKGTIKLLASFFKDERLKVGSGGLYRKYQPYLEPFFIFFGILSYSSVAKALEIDIGSLSDKITQQLWPLLSDLYSPWLVPYWIGNGDRGQTAQWAQEQSFERFVLLPWFINDSCHASFCASIFSESVRFVFDALPGHNQVLSHVWFFYVTNFAHIHAKDYILNVIHDSLISLPWETFFPNLQDVELMLKVVDQFLPLSHSFLGNIFVNIKWTELVQCYMSCYDLEINAKLHICLLHLLVKLPLEPSLKQNEKVMLLLTEAKEYAWHLVDSKCYDDVLNWFIMSSDPRIILMDERLEYFKLDSTILSLLRACAGYVPSAKLYHSTTTTKRSMFVKTCVKWLITSNRRFKSKDSPLFKSALYTIWDDMETIIVEIVPPHQRLDEANLLLSEFLTIFSEPELSSLVEVTFCNWLSTRRCQVIAFGLFRSAGVSIENPKVFGSLIESSLESYFSFAENCDWSEITKVLVPFSKSKSDAHLEKVLTDNNHFLTLYAILLKKFQSNQSGFSFKLVLTDLLQLLSEAKLGTTLEPKLILLIVFALKLAENEMKFNLKEGISYLIKISDTLNNFVNDKGNGFLSVIGLKKSATTNRFRLICLITCSSITIYLKNNYSQHQENIDDKILQALESADTNKVYQNIHQYASYAKSAVKEMSSIEQIASFLKHIGLKLFNKLYLK